MMLEKIGERERKNSLTVRDVILYSLVIVLVVAIGLFAVNQYLEYRYKAVWLSTPCDLCLELNEHIDLCPKAPNLFDTNNFNNVTIKNIYP